MRVSYALLCALYALVVTPAAAEPVDVTIVGPPAPQSTPAAPVSDGVFQVYDRNGKMVGQAYPPNANGIVQVALELNKQAVLIDITSLGFFYQPEFLDLVYTTTDCSGQSYLAASLFPTAVRHQTRFYFPDGTPQRILVQSDKLVAPDQDINQPGKCTKRNLMENVAKTSSVPELGFIPPFTIKRSQTQN